MALLVVPILGMMALRKLGKAPVETRVKGTIAMCFADPSRLPKQRYDEMVAEARARAEHPGSTSRCCARRAGWCARSS